MASFVYSLVLLYAIQSSCHAAKFAMISMKGRSHYLVLERLGKELVSRGHEVKFNYVNTLPVRIRMKIDKFIDV